VTAFSPAFWVIPSRCYLYREGTIAEKVRQTSSVFYRFKVGEEELAYPLARAIYSALTTRKMVDFDAVVPIPLSPDKEEEGEIHRTRLLAKELARLLGTRVSETLSLKCPISKHKLRITLGLSAGHFEARYSQALVVDEKVQNYNRILLVDDVCTEGSTLRSAIGRLRAAKPELEITTAAAGQMIIKSVVRDGAGLLKA
jgi:predicted amidophosphoribosyltransferase